MRTVAGTVRIGAVVVAFLAVVSIMSACGDGMFGMDEHHQQMHGGGGGAPQTPVLSNASQVEIEIADFDFSPRDMTVAAGAAVTWTNRDSAPHDATAETDAWGTQTLRQGESAIITFNDEGVYEYLCTIHPDMRGTLTVQADV